MQNNFANYRETYWSRNSKDQNNSSCVPKKNHLYKLNDKKCRNAVHQTRKISEGNTTTIIKSHLDPKQVLVGTREEVRGSLDCTEFQQDGSTFHTARMSLEWLSYHLREPLKSSSLISAVSWPARYPDQTPCMSFYGEFEVANTYMDLCQRVCRILRTKSRWPFAAFGCRRWPREAPCARLEQNRGHIEHVLNMT